MESAAFQGYSLEPQESETEGLPHKEARTWTQSRPLHLMPG